MKRRGNWSRGSIARDRERFERAHHDPHTCAKCNPLGPATDEVMVAYAAHLTDVYGPAPDEGWDDYEPNTWGGS